MNHNTTNVNSSDSNGNNGNGNGSVLTKLSKTSWVWILLVSFGSAGVGGYYTLKQDQTVQGATLQIQITDLKTQVSELKTNQEKLLENVVPRSEHNVRIELQKEVDQWRDKYFESMFNKKK